MLIASVGIMMGREVNQSLPKGLDSVDIEVIDIFQGLINENSNPYLTDLLSGYFDKPASSTTLADGYNSIGVFLIDLKKYDEAEKILICVTEKADIPDSLRGSVHCNLGYLYEKTGREQLRDEHNTMAIGYMTS